MTRSLPTPTQAKQQAKELRETLSAQGTRIGHSEALEKVAHHYGFRDWNAMFAAIRDRAPENLQPGGRVRGAYLSQAFTATVVSAAALRPGWFRVVLDLDEAVDVVPFESFSNLRKRLRADIGPDGHSKEHTSDGQPQLFLDT